VRGEAAREPTGRLRALRLCLQTSPPGLPGPAEERHHIGSGSRPANPAVANLSVSPLGNLSDRRARVPFRLTPLGNESTHGEMERCQLDVGLIVTLGGDRRWFPDEGMPKAPDPVRAGRYLTGEDLELDTPAPRQPRGEPATSPTPGMASRPMIIGRCSTASRASAALRYRRTTLRFAPDPVSAPTNPRQPSPPTPPGQPPALETSTRPPIPGLRPGGPTTQPPHLLTAPSSTGMPITTGPISPA
jgi:hypothetical protein